MHGAGTFRLAQSLQEWGELDSSLEIDMADCVQILHDRVGTFTKGQIVSKKFFPEIDSLYDLGAIADVGNDYEGTCIEPDQPIVYLDQPAMPIPQEQDPAVTGEPVIQVTRVELLPDTEEE